MTGGAIRGWTRSHWTRAVAVSAFLTVLHSMASPVHPNRFGESAADVIRLSDEDGRLEKLAGGRNGLTLDRLRPSSSAQQ